VHGGPLYKKKGDGGALYTRGLGTFPDVSADEVLVALEAHLLTVLGEPVARAAVTFLGTERIEVLRFDAADVVRYVTLGMARHPMVDPTATVAAVSGPRAELVLSLRDPRDEVFRALAVLAASPVVEGVVVGAGASLGVGRPLWPGAGFEAVLVGEPGGLVPDLDTGDGYAVSCYPLFPMTPAEAAWKRVHGAAALEERWLTGGVDLRDPRRTAVSLT
jgi:hypothetical protein